MIQSNLVEPTISLLDQHDLTLDVLTLLGNIMIDADENFSLLLSQPEFIEKVLKHLDKNQDFERWFLSVLVSVEQLSDDQVQLIFDYLTLPLKDIELLNKLFSSRS